MRKSFSAKWFVRGIDEDWVYFNYKRAPYLRSIWPVVIIALIEVIVLVSELVLNHSAYLQVLMVPLILYCLSRILKHKEDIDKETESKIVQEQLATIHPGPAKAKVVAKEYFIVTPKEVYLREKRFLLVVMSNGKVYRYGVELAEKGGFILDKKATLCKDDSELVLVKKYTDSLKGEEKTRKKKEERYCCCGYSGVWCCVHRPYDLVRGYNNLDEDCRLGCICDICPIICDYTIA